MELIKAPNRPRTEEAAYTVFLAGSIEMDTAPHWQEIAEKHFAGSSYRIYNPRRDDWNSSWKHDINDPQFYQQVDWELEHLEKASTILMYFSPETKSPITLLELGLFAKSKRLVVVCPRGFWRKGNVDIICYKNDIPLFEDLKKALNSIYGPSTFSGQL